jgi:hypothetical protein
MFLALINIDIRLCSKLVYTVLCLNCKNYGANIPTIFTSCPVDLLVHMSMRFAADVLTCNVETALFHFRFSATFA